jgi:tetratricopeptide (TPR) repeat protein
MNPKETVQAFGGSSMARPDVYSNGKDDSTITTSKAYKALGAEGWNAGLEVAESFKSQWKHEQYSLVYFDGSSWYKGIDYADQYYWKEAMDIWMGLLDTNDLLKRSCAEYNIAVACYMLGDIKLASEWLDRSDADNKLPLSDALRKRIDSRLN